MSTGRNIKAVILLFIMVITVALSSLFVVVESNHHCDDDNCRICVTIQNCLTGMKKIASDAGEVVLLAVNFAFFAVLLFAFENFVGVITPVGLKVKLTN